MYRNRFSKYTFQSQTDARSYLRMYVGKYVGRINHEVIFDVLLK